MYDIIGDIHGYAEPLVRLLEKMDYENTEGYYKHPERTAIFLGDFVDRGPDQMQVVDIAKKMVENGSALAVMGNHEFNALAFHTENPDNPGVYLRPRSNKNIGQHVAFLNEYLPDPKALEDTLDWFKTLPMWLELDGLRIIHACWDDRCLSLLKDICGDGGLLTDELLHKASIKGSDEFKAVETILKGKEIKLPEGEFFNDKMGTIRHEIRVKWWDNTATTYQQAYMGPEEARLRITDAPIDTSDFVPYPEDAPPVFMGHYWYTGTPSKLASNIVCTDYSVAKQGGKLAAYRWSPNKPVSDNNFIWVEADAKLEDN